jgi:hypothetical protein
MKVLLIGIFFSFTAFAQHSLEIVGDKKIFVGDSVQLVLKTKKVIDQNLFDNLLKENKKKIGPFYIVNLSFMTSEAKQSLIGLSAIYERSFEGNNIVLKLTKDEQLNLTFNGSSLLDQKNIEEGQELQIVDRSLSLLEKSFWWKYLLGAILLIAILGLMILPKHFRRRKLLAARKEKFEKFLKVFSDASVREDFEYIYKTRSEWSEFLAEQQVTNFLKLIAEIQYKQTWSQLEMSEVTSHFKLIRNKLSYGV